MRFFPAPTSIFGVLWQMLQPSPQYPAGELWAQVSISLSRIVVGFLVGAVPGIVLGLAMGLFSPIRAIIQPLVDGTPCWCW
jgi:NitT/TauT family transport system permease protein